MEEAREIMNKPEVYSMLGCESTARIYGQTDALSAALPLSLHEPICYGITLLARGALPTSPPPASTPFVSRLLFHPPRSLSVIHPIGSLKSERRVERLRT